MSLNNLYTAIRINQFNSFQMESTWVAGYYSVLFEDPDGIRLEVNFVPGAGILQPGASFNPKDGYEGDQL